jgi:thiamine-phosphate pyrophosphorylase
LYCSACDLPVYENPIPATAAVVVNEQGQVLLVKRKVDPKAGEWCLPGGFLELDESPEEGCLRELQEETGLEGKILSQAGNISGSSPLYKAIIIMGYNIDIVGGTLQAGDDCEEARYFSLEEMPLITFRSHRLILERALHQRNESADKEPGKKKKIKARWLTDFGAYVITSGNHLEIAEKACNAGARILQYRDKTSTRQEMLETAAAIRQVTRQYNTIFIVNDFIDIALLAEADGVHLGQEDIPIARAREITPPGFIIGRSTHSLEQALEAEKQGADYIGSGPVYATPTKADYVPIGVDTLKQVLAAVHLPVVAIGGLNPGNITPLLALGARNFAMVRAFQTDTAKAVQEINSDLF